MDAGGSGGIVVSGKVLADKRVELLTGKGDINVESDASIETAASGGTQVFNASGKYVAGTYWNSSGKWVYTGNLTVYAQWTANKSKVTCSNSHSWFIFKLILVTANLLFP